MQMNATAHYVCDRDQTVLAVVNRVDSSPTTRSQQPCTHTRPPLHGVPVSHWDRLLIHPSVCTTTTTRSIRVTIQTPIRSNSEAANKSVIGTNSSPPPPKKRVPLVPTNSFRGPNWDVSFLLNRKYGLTAMNSDLDFPMDISTPEDGLLYSVPAQTIFSDKKFPDEPIYIQLNFQPNTSLTEFYFLTIRDPDDVMRFSLSMYKRNMYRVQMRYNLLESNEGERTIDFPYPQPPSYWRLGVLIKENSVQFFTNCPRFQTAPFHEETGVKLLGRPLFRDGASAYLLNSGRQSSPKYLEGVLTEFTFHSGHDVEMAPCKTTVLEEGSGEPMYTFDPEFGNVISDRFFTQVPPSAEPQSRVSCHFFPIIDLTNGVVRLFDPKAKSVLMESQVYGGVVHFTNGTVMRPCKSFVALEDPVKVVTVVNLSTGDVELIDTAANRSLAKSLVSKRLPADLQQLEVRPVLTWKNFTVEIDTLNGRWMVRNHQTGQFVAAKNVENGQIIMPSGEVIPIPLKIRNPRYVLMLAPHSGYVRIFRRSDGRMYKRVIYVPTFTTTTWKPEASTVVPEAGEVSTPSMVEFVTDSTATSISTPLIETANVPCVYLPIVDLTDGSVHLYLRNEDRVVMESYVRDGIVVFDNGTRMTVCDAFVAFDDPLSSITKINLGTGEVELKDSEDKVTLMKSDVSHGLPVDSSKTRVVLTWKNVTVRIDTRNGDWFVSDPETGELTKAKEVANGRQQREQ
ncbi:unnamed protein product [Mesocestoides corti]|uniref:Uncharacterized protein n=1 Tax=Mesocestoides corti TaxID=53468 RepID=A0A158QTI9_MESCO|nr:unnamed protein product [Mesocestoides corti]